MRELIDTQKKIGISIAVLVLVLLCAWLFLYRPTASKLKELKTRFHDIEAAIRQIESIASRGKDLKDSIMDLEETRSRLKQKFPAKEEESLRILSQLARDNDIEVIRFKPQSKKLFRSAGDRQGDAVIEGKTCRQLSVVLELRSTYHDLLHYIDALKSSGAAFFVVRKMELRKNYTDSRLLSVGCTIDFYYLSS